MEKQNPLAQAAVNFYRRGNSGLALFAKDKSLLPDHYAVALRVDDAPTFNDLELTVNDALNRGDTFSEIMGICADFIESRI